MSLAIVAAKAALMRKQANAGKLALGLAAAGGAGLAGRAAVHELTAPDPDEVPEAAPVAPVAAAAAAPVALGLGANTPVAADSFKGRRLADKMTLRDKLRATTNDTVSSGVGSVLKRWYNANTGRVK